MLPEEIIDSILSYTDFNTCIALNRPIVATLIRSQHPIVLIIEHSMKTIQIDYKNGWRLKVTTNHVIMIECSTISSMITCLLTQCDPGYNYDAFIASTHNAQNTQNALNTQFKCGSFYYLDNKVEFTTWINDLVQMTIGMNKLFTLYRLLCWKRN